MIHDHREFGRPSGKLVDPILYRTQRSQDQEWTIGALLTKKSQERNQLNRLPQAHLISQNPVEPNLVKAREPSESLELVITHLAAGNQFWLFSRLNVSCFQRPLELIHDGGREALK